MDLLDLTTKTLFSVKVAMIAKKSNENTKIRNQRQGAIPLCQGSTCPCPKNAENIFDGNLLADLGGTPPHPPLRKKIPSLSGTQN